MDKLELIAIVVITNASGSNVSRTSSEWMKEGLVLGCNLFFCGPRSSLEGVGIKDEAIIDYVDRPYYLGCFHINEKKRIACEAVKAEYIYLVHDRFFPESGFFNKLVAVLKYEKYDFGAVDVVNLDGSLALGELRLKVDASKIDLDKALEPIGRLVCDRAATDASECLGINGGQFFIKKTMIKHLKRPMRWAEMEDDILSHDLRNARGIWIPEARLVTLIRRIAPNANVNSQFVQFKYFCYRLICNLVANLVGAYSVGQKIESDQLSGLIKNHMLIIDPLHKFASSESLPSSLEKIMARSRVLGQGKSWAVINKTVFGWSLVGFKNNEI